MKKPNYKDKETGEKKIRSYLEMFIAEHEPEAKWTDITLAYKNIDVFVVSFDKLSNHTLHDLGVKYDFNEIPENFILIFKSEKCEKQLDSAFIFKNHDKINSLAQYFVSLAVKESLEAYLSNTGLTVDGFFGFKWRDGVYFIGNGNEAHKLISSVKSSAVPDDTDYPSMIVLSSNVILNEATEPSSCSLKSITSEPDSEINSDDFFHIFHENLIRKFHELCEGEEVLGTINESLILKDKEIVIRDEKSKRLISKGVFTGIDKKGFAVLKNADPVESVELGEMVLSSEFKESKEEEDFNDFTKAITVSIVENDKKDKAGSKVSNSAKEEVKDSEKAKVEKEAKAEDEAELSKDLVPIDNDENKNQIVKKSTCYYCRFISRFSLYGLILLLSWYYGKKVYNIFYGRK